MAFRNTITITTTTTTTTTTKIYSPRSLEPSGSGIKKGKQRQKDRSPQNLLEATFPSRKKTGHTDQEEETLV